MRAVLLTDIERRWAPNGFLFLPLLATGCTTPVYEACSMEFRAVPVTVMDDQAALVTDATVTTTHVRTGEVVHINSLVFPSSGTYLVLDDSALELFRHEGTEEFLLKVTRPAHAPATETYRFTGMCHVVKVAGPDTLQVP